MVNTPDKKKLPRTGIVGNDQLTLNNHLVRWWSDGSEVCKYVHNILQSSESLIITENDQKATNIEIFIAGKGPNVTSKVDGKTKKVVIILEDHDESKKQAINEGANAYVEGVDLQNSKEFLDKVETMVKQLASGREVDPIYEQLIGTDLARLLNNRNSNLENNSELSNQDFFILSRISNGYKDGEIAHEVKCATQTIKNRLTKIRHQIGAKTRTHAVAIAMRNEWI